MEENTLEENQATNLDEISIDLPIESAVINLYILNENQKNFEDQEIINPNNLDNTDSFNVNLFESESQSESRREDPENDKSTFDLEKVYENTQEPDKINPCQNKKELILSKNYNYIGETLNGLRDGFGISKYNKGKIYIGYWKNDKMEGVGKLTYENGDCVDGEFSNDKLCGYSEYTKHDKNTKIKGYLKDNKFIEFIIFEKNEIKYEGEPQINNDHLSFGKLTISKGNSKKIFVGNVKDYLVESGVGLFIKDNFLFYGEMKNKVMINYIETYSADSATFLGFVKDSKKNGLGICFLKDGRACLGQFENDLKKGPVFLFSNLPKPNIRMELYILGFRAKSVDKIDSIKKYISVNYPEYIDVLKMDFQKMIDKLTPEINEEISYSVKLIEKFKSGNF